MADREETQEDVMICGLNIAERDRLKERLDELPDTMPPRAVWKRIEAQAHAEGLLRGHGHRQRVKWLAGAALAAAVALVALRFPVSVPIDEIESFPTEPSYDEVSANNGAQTLSALMIQSAQLERNLRSLPEQPQLVRAGTVATIAELEDRIAEIDYWLNHPEIELNPDQSEIYWTERVRLMNSLLRLRTAQTQRIAF